MIMLGFPVPDLPFVVDPARVQHVSHVMIARQLHASLVSVSQGGTVTPDLASRWSLSKDRKSLVFVLKAATFSNGEKIRPAHIVRTFERLALSKAAVASDLSFIRGFEQSAGRKSVTPEFGVTAKGEEEVEFKLVSFSPVIFQILGLPDCGIVPSSDVNEFSASVGMASSGAWRVVEVESRTIVIEKWRQNQHESKSPPRRIEFVRVGTEGRSNLAKSGKVDSLADTSLNAEEVKEFQRKGWIHATPDTSRFLFARVGPSLDRSTKLDVAEAFARFREGFLAPDDAFKPLYGVFPPFLEEGFGKSEYSAVLKAARASSPRPRGARAAKRPLRFAYLEKNQRLAVLVTLLVAALRESGFDVVEEPLPIGDLLNRTKTKDFDVLISSKGLEYADAYSVLTYFRSGYEQNDFNIESRKIDEALGAVVRTDDKSKTLQLYREIQREILSSFAYLPIAYGSGASGLWSPKVKSAPATPLGVHTLRFEQIEVR
jgi:oligopeptide transport system substrate-binding protein